jgi:hypothetical protein
MFRSVKKAEEAALRGEGGEEFDTQQCQDLMQEILSVTIYSQPVKFARMALTIDRVPGAAPESRPLKMIILRTKTR